jgi:hypothetical protein
MSNIRKHKFQIRLKRFVQGLIVFSTCVGIVLILVVFHESPKKYVGVVVDVSSWSGNAKLRTSSSKGMDTIIDVQAQKNEVFSVGQTITVWSGGELFTGIATTKPQN